MDTRGRCWTVIAEPGSLSYRTSSRLESKAGCSPILSDFVFWKLLEVPGLGGAKRHADGCEDLSEVCLGSSGLHIAPAWGAGWSEPWVALEDLGLPPGDRGILYTLCLEEQGELRKKDRPCSMTKRRTLLPEQPQARSRLGTWWDTTGGLVVEGQEEADPGLSGLASC